MKRLLLSLLVFFIVSLGTTSPALAYDDAFQSGQERFDALQLGTTQKKGVGMWSLSPNLLPSVGATWFYNWQVSHADGRHIPMIWHGWSRDHWRDASPQNVQAIQRSKAPAVLGFNEPDLCGSGAAAQSCMSVNDAVGWWPAVVEAAGGSNYKRIGSPAVASNYNWLRDFMREVDSRRLRVDFIAAHIYPDNIGRDPDGAVRKVVDLVTRLHSDYGRPVWLTEVGICSWSGGGWVSEQAAWTFTTKLVAALDSLPFVERYAWFFETGGYGGCGQSGIWNGNGSLTKVGQAYGASSFGE